MLVSHLQIVFRTMHSLNIAFIALLSSILNATCDSRFRFDT